MIYTAGPFFNPEQIQVQSRIEELCRKNSINFFSPRLECFCPPDATNEQRSETFRKNRDSIIAADMILARIDDYDPGTMWELGYAHAFGVPSFAYTTFPDRGLNLMLAESGLKIVRGWTAIERFLAGDKAVAEGWKGSII